MNNIKDSYLRKSSVFWDYIDISKDVFIEIDRDLDIVDCNLAFCELKNRSRQHLTGRSILESIPQKDREKFKKNIDQIFNLKNKEEIFKLTILGKKGIVKKVMMKFNLVVDETNSVDCVFLKFSTYVERINDSKLGTLFQSIYNSLSEQYTILATRKDGRINHINSKVVDLLGYSESELINKNVVEFYADTPENRKAVIEMRNCLQKNEEWAGEIAQRSKNGEVIPVFLSVTSLRHNGEIIGRIGVGRDLREEKKLAAENEAFSFKLQGRSKLAEFGMMLQGVAHNLNTPLTGIKSSAQLQKSKLNKFRSKLEEKYGEDPLISKMLDSIVKSTDLINSSSVKMSRIIKNMMTKARQEQSNSREVLNLCSVMEQELEFMMANMFFKHKVEKEFELQRELPVVYGLYSDFSQIFTNLIKNALDAMFDTEIKRLVVVIFSDEKNIYVKIKDTGKGIAPENHEKIFEPFFTTKPKLTEANGNEPTGTGIGLESVKSLLEPYQAVIDFSSEIGVGTEFRIVIPIEKNLK